MDISLMVVGPEVFSVPSSWHQTSVRPLQFAGSRLYHPFDNVWSLPILPDDYNAGFFGVGVDFSEDQVALFESPLFDLRIEISLRSPFVRSNSKSRHVAFFFEQVKFISLECEVLFLVVGLAAQGRDSNLNWYHGFDPVEVCEVILQAHNTFGNSSAQSPLRSSSFVFRLNLMILLTTST